MIYAAISRDKPCISPVKGENNIYQVNLIKSLEELKYAPVFHISHFQWSKNYRPEAYGQMCLLADYGLVISMTALEREPLRRYTQDDDPVYRDSAVEAFFDFTPGQPESNYLNFEMNSNGAMLSGYGSNSSHRAVKECTPWRACCEAVREEEQWSVLLRIPMELICDLYKIAPLKAGDTFTCNFYKISEDPEWEHYASYSPIISPVPNFHLPEFFGQAIICETM